MTSRSLAAFADLGESLRKPYLWRGLAWFDIKQRFRRSVLGPLWITLTMAALIAGMGPLYAAIFDLELKTYLPYLALGVIIWGYISTTTMEACNAFIAGAGVIRQTRIPLSSFVLRTVWRNLLVLAFNGVLAVAVIVYAGVPSLAHWVEALLGLLLLILASVGAGFLIGVFCTRYRDMQQLIGSLLQLLMFLTPVFWRADQLKQRSVLVDWNPAYYFLEAVRGPLLGADVPAHTFGAAAGIAFALLMAGVALFARYRLRIVYWL
jgi:ABC-type polysaccharide/polyol phosphate export permease